MPSEGARFMRLLVFFDLPVKTREERREAEKFRRFLLSDGYSMMQFSVYSRVCRGQDMVDTYLAHLKCNLPPSGCVRVLQITEQQYARMKIVVGNPKPHERAGAVQLLLL